MHTSRSFIRPRRHREKHAAEDQDKCQAVEDYKTELALLEQQNKARLMRARGEYDALMAAAAEEHKE